MLKRVLAAVDGSVISRRVASFAHDLAHATGARLTVLHVVEPLPDSVVAPFGLSSSDLHQALLLEGQVLVETVCRDAGIAAADQLVHLGPAGQTICTEAEECGADLIVLGYHGRGAGARVMLGSVGSRVAALAKASVTIIR
jgi:universal stress protein A